MIVNCGNRWASKQPLEGLPNFLSKIEKKNGKVIVFCILLWKWKYFVYCCESESIWQHLANRYLRSHSGFIHQLKMEFDTQSFISKYLQKDIKHQAGFIGLKCILIISTVHHPSTERWEQPYLAYLQIEARLNTHKLRPCKNTNLTFLILHLCSDDVKHQELHILCINNK